MADLDDLAVAGAQASEDPIPVARGNRPAADDHRTLADAHQDVGVIERRAGAIGGLKDHRLVLQLPRPFRHQLRMGAR